MVNLRDMWSFEPPLNPCSPLLSFDLFCSPLILFEIRPCFVSHHELSKWVYLGRGGLLVGNGRARRARRRGGEMRWRGGWIESATTRDVSTHFKFNCFSKPHSFDFIHPRPDSSSAISPSTHHNHQNRIQIPEHTCMVSSKVSYFQEDSRVARPTCQAKYALCATETRKFRLLPSVHGQRKDRGLGREIPMRLSRCMTTCSAAVDGTCRVYDTCSTAGDAGILCSGDARACLPRGAVAARTPTCAFLWPNVSYHRIGPESRLLCYAKPGWAGSYPWETMGRGYVSNILLSARNRIHTPC